jgi:pyridoxal phosphate enzyme (YggS family)
MRLEERLQTVLRRIREAECSARRPEGSVRLLAVSKGQPAELLREAYALGLREFGENYLQEALRKQEALADLDLVWHFIGPIQSNKTRNIAARFAWVHSIDRLKIAERLSEQRPESLPPLDVCLQVKLGAEESKSGVDPAALPELAAAVRELPRLRLRGLMTIPPPSDDPVAQRTAFRQLREALEGLALPEFDTLSMGMSNDLEAAIAEGSTLVRIGTALFGPRPKRPHAAAQTGSEFRKLRPNC